MERDELHERLMVLKEELEAGKVVFVKGLPVTEALLNVKYAVDGKVDPETVDSSVRALANSVYYLRQREQLKQTPLRKVQELYFELLEQYFSQPFTEMKRHNLDAYTIAADMASNERTVKVFTDEHQEFAESIKNFWQQLSPVVDVHIEDMQCLKSVYGGDIFPSYTNNIACSVGLYMDTIILPDPLLRTSQFFNFMSPDRALFYLIKHALNALAYKDLALAEVDPPILVIAPDFSTLNESDSKLLHTSGEADLLVHCSKLFGRQFSNVKQLTTYLKKFPTQDKLIKALRDPSRLLYNVEWPNSASEQLQRFITETQSQFTSPLAPTSIGQSLYLSLTGRMVQINDIIFKGSRYEGSPLVDAPTSWQYLLWKYEYDRERSNALHPSFEDVVISHALQATDDPQLHLLSNLPPEALIELRQKGALVELREIIRQGINEIDNASPIMLAEVTDAISHNITEALAQHQKDLNEFRSGRLRFFGWDISSWLVVGGISITAASTGNIPLSILGAALGTVGASSAKDLWTHGRELLQQGQQLKRSPTGILIKNLNHKE